MSAPMIVAGGAARPSARAGLSAPPTDGTKVIKKTVEPSMASVMASFSLCRPQLQAPRD